MATKFNRQIEDYILTDLLPVEKGNFFTHRMFYEYLIKNDFNSFSKDNDEFYTSLLNRKFHATPLDFKIKNKKGFREISILNPLSIIGSFYFISYYGDTIIDLIQKNNKYGVRIPYKQTSLLYKYRNGSTVYYQDIDDRQQLLINLESSGSFYYHKPYKRISQFLNSERNSFLHDKFKISTKFDIENFFGSIYTHTYKWLITNNPLDAIELNNNKSIFLAIDKFLQNINGAKSNGLVIGPEMSRILAEFLLVHIEKEIETEISSKKITINQDYKLYRFVDDYFLFTNDKETADEILKITKSVLNEYQLKINDKKTVQKETINITNVFIDYIKIIVSDYIKPIFEEEKANKLFYSSIRNKIKILISEIGEQERIASYLLSTLVSLLEKSNVDNTTFRKKEFTNLCFFIASLNPDYISIQKLITICNQLLKYDDMEKEYIEHSLYRFSDNIFSGYESDWINLLIFIGTENINLSRVLELKLIDDYLTVEENTDPRIIAGFLIYLKTTDSKNDYSEYYKKIEKIIRNKIFMINREKFFQDKNSWWVFIFSSCNYKEFMDLNSCVIKYLQRLKDDLGYDKNDSNLAEKAKDLTLEFLINGGGFINWSFSNEETYKKFYFYTRNRTVFNPGSIDSLEISY